MYFSSISVSLLALVTVSIADFNILLLHTNDMHARFQQADRYLGMCANDSETDCYGGFARLKTEVEKQKQIAQSKNRSTIFLNAGDTFQGTPYYTFFKWPIVSKFVSMLGLDVMSLGNHEFDDGVSDLAQYIANVTVPNICSNLDLTLEPSLKENNLTPSIVLNVNGVMIGVIGYLTPDTLYLADTGKVKILDEIPSIRAEAQRLQAEGINILIAVGHSGYIKDQQIAKEVQELDVVVGGHSHTFLYSGTPPDPVDVPKGPYPTVVTQDSGKDVPVVQAYYGTKYLGYLELNFDDNGNLKSWNGQPILLSGDKPQDPGVLAALEPYETQLRSTITRIVGYSGVLLDNEAQDCKLGECNMGNMIADAFVDYAARHYTATQGWTEAAVGLIQAGGMRASINPQTNINRNGSVTLGDVITVLPWGAKIVVKDLTGEVILKMLEYSVHRYEETVLGHVNEFFQVSGLKVEFDVKAKPYHRVVSVQIRCADCTMPVYQPLNTSKTYGVAMPEYIGSGGDGYDFIANIPNALIFDDIDYVVVSQYITLHSPIHPTIEGRITFINSTSSSAHKTSWLSWVFVLHILVLLSLGKNI